MQHRATAILLASIACATCFAQAESASQPRSGTQTTYVPVADFNASRDAAADIRAAIAEAQRTGKRIILYVGGPWCPYCDQMEQLFQKNPELRQYRDAHFITLPIYVGSENDNSRALSPYTPVLGVPHFFVLDRNGKLLYSQHMVELRENADYSLSKMKEFLARWADSGLEGKGVFPSSGSEDLP